MYHVATLLPHSEKDPQQLERKRFLGNDIVTIIFHDGNTPFNPCSIKSEYNQVFIVVRREFETWK
jgi:RAP1 GTPase activating protein 1